ncbi:MAG: YihY/virulence factor BrkB family protein, partial [Muribaculaceae bacterium]|nr:YihY/virulence factor BrkB family protein [Muribaculaceae bacterium]
MKTLNLSVRSFMRSDLQTLACGLTYRALLAVVPALALLFAIGRGFGLQNLLTTQLFTYFPSQKKALETAIGFVASYVCLLNKTE